MRNQSVLRKVISLILLFSFSSCGYKPSIYYTKKVIDGDVYANVDININSSQNSVALKDILNEVLVSQFKVTLVDKKHSSTQVSASLGRPSFSILQYDSEGFASIYRVRVSVSMIVRTEQIVNKYSGSGFYDYSVSKGATSSDAQKILSTKEAIKKAMESIVANIIYVSR